MTFDELDAEIRERITKQPRGFQAELANRLGTTRQYISHVVSGRSPISREHYQTILDLLGIEMFIRESAVVHTRPVRQAPRNQGVGHGI